MKLIIKLFFILGIAFWGSGLLYSFSKLIALNGLGNIFEMNEARNAKKVPSHNLKNSSLQFFTSNLSLYICVNDE